MSASRSCVAEVVGIPTPISATLSVDGVPGACAVIAHDGCVLEANHRWLALFACGKPVVGRNLSEWFPSHPDALELLGTAAESPRRLQARRDDRVPVSLLLQALADRRTRTLTCIAQEVAGTQLLGESQRYLDVAFETAPIGMALFDTSGRYVRVNPALCRLLGRSAGQLIGRRDQEFTHPADRQADVTAAWRILEGELDCWQTEKRFTTPGGEIVWVIASLSFLRDEQGMPLSWLGQFQDITSRKHREERLGHLAVHDELTGIANRRGLLQRLAEAHAAGEAGAVLVFDLDGFKQINDLQGHHAGDLLLRQTACALGRRLRAEDFLARLGGDEFAVILPSASMETARGTAAELLADVRRLNPDLLSASCGVAPYGEGTSAEAVLAAADELMYAAKSQGRNRVRGPAGQPAEQHRAERPRQDSNLRPTA